MRVDSMIVCRFLEMEKRAVYRAARRFPLSGRRRSEIFKIKAIETD
jgi:hypothetical protein